MNHPIPQSTQASAPSVVEMAVFVILFLWIASLPSNQTGPHRPARTDHHLASRLPSQLEGWMETNLRGSSFDALYHHLHACIVGPE